MNRSHAAAGAAIGLALAAALALPTSAAADETLPLVNPSFEDDLEGWTVDSRDSENALVTADAAAGGNRGLQLRDTDLAQGYRITSSEVDIEAGKIYSVTFMGKSNGKGDGIGVEMLFRGGGSEPIPPINVPRFWQATTIRGNPGTFSRYTLKARAPEGAYTLAILIRSFSSPDAEAMLDDFVVTRVDETAEAAAPAP